MTSTLLSGSKFNSNHQTYIPNAKPFLLSLKKLDSVKKIFLGEITTTRSGKQSAKISKLNAGMWEITFRGVIAVQKFRVVGGSESDLKKLVDEHKLNKMSKTKQ